MIVYDLTQDNQLSSVTGMVPGLFLAGANPYLVGEIVYPPAMAVYEAAAAYAHGTSMLNIELNIKETSYSTGLATVASGIVTIAGGTLPSSFPFNVIAGRFCIGNAVYDVASRDSDTQLTLTDLSVNVPVPSAYKFSEWDYRETDPHYAFNDAEWHYAFDEVAFPLSLISADAITNNAQIGMYGLLDNAWRNGTLIIDDGDTGSYAAWQASVVAACNYVTVHGFTLKDWLIDHGGKVWWPNYVPTIFLGSEHNRNRWMLRNQRMKETFDSIGLPHAPLFLRHSIEGFSSFYATGTGEEISDAYQQQMIDALDCDFGWWHGMESETYGYPMAGYTFPAESFAAYQAAHSTSRKRRSAAEIATPDAAQGEDWRRQAADVYSFGNELTFVGTADNEIGGATSYASGQTTPPAFSAVGAMTTGGAEFSGEATVTEPDPDTVPDPDYSFSLRSFTPEFIYGGGFNYGEPAPRALFSFPMPPRLRAAPLIVNRLEGPSTVWCEGIDYVLNFELGLIQFIRNPFESGFATRDVYQDQHTPDDVEAGLWIFGAKFEDDFVADHHGYVLGINLPSSDNYRDFINSLYDGLVEGGHYRALSEAVAAVVDAPLVREDEETVHAISRDHRGRFVVTDKHVYRFSDSAWIIVSYGDVLHRGDPLSNAALIHEFHHGQIPYGLAALTIDGSFLPGTFQAGLTFENRLVDVIVSESAGVRQARFELGGWPDDVQEFWETVETAGLTAGETFADLLAAQPGGIPRKINPLRFLTANIFRNNVFLVELWPAAFGPGALPLKCLRFLRRLIPPHTAMIVLARLEASDEPIIMDGPGDEDVPGYEEDIAPFTAGEPLLDTVSTSDVSETSQLSYVDGICV